jgi:hypothetical protein
VSARERSSASGLNCFEGNLRNERTGIVLTTIAAQPLFVSESEALTEEDPAARAPLPPSLRIALGEAGGRQISDPASSVMDRPRPHLSQEKPRPHLAPDRSTLALKKRDPSGERSMSAASHPGDRRTALEKAQRRHRPLVGPEVGISRPRAAIPLPVSVASANPWRSRIQPDPRTFRVIFPARLHTAMPRITPTHGRHPVQ